MGIREFRERLGEIARSGQSVELTDRGRMIGTYTPWPQPDPVRLARAREAAAEIDRWQNDLRQQGINTEDWLADMGMDPWGIPLPTTE